MQIKLDPFTFPVYGLAKVMQRDGNWIIQDVELYADPERTKLIADDVAKDLPQSSIDAVIGACDEHDHKTRMLSRKLVREMAR